MTGSKFLIHHLQMKKLKRFVVFHCVADPIIFYALLLSATLCPSCLTGKI